MIPVYKLSFEEARNNGEYDLFIESFEENRECRRFLDKQITRCYHDGFLRGDYLEQTIAEFGIERTLWVIANTIE